ncbi:ABC transporter permease [Isoptericola sp. b441]|uniref:ABC transporter permease n=1 Tax=Actinotalea lenta TaxID=3064654 RepID=A0ABT9DCJ9_9CELL|nr:ABC transporter permease [Isoptericola sp. b441]MDO8108630.1 ABC transporter permease [Isoptericola sp. b441]
MTAQIARVDLPTEGTVRRWIRETDQPLFLYVSFAVLISAFSLATPIFLTASNLLNIANQTALVTIMAMGVAFVIITAEIDLSVGSTLALSGVCAALFMRDAINNWLLAAIVAIAVGAMVGAVNGVLAVRIRIPSFLVTLGTLSMARGITLLVTGTSPVLVNNETFWSVFAEGTFIGIAAPILWTVLVVAIAWAVLHYGIFGRQLYATGGNIDAARFSGINTRRVKTVAFIVSGALAGLAGTIVAARGHAIRPDVGAGVELDVIAAVILGGVSLFGGKGKIYGVILGSLIIGILNNGLVLLGVDPSIQLTIKGFLIVVAVAFAKR